MDVRAVWAHEALDFTPCWLRTWTCWARSSVEAGADHAGEPVGPFYLTFAKDTDTGGLVAIENRWSGRTSPSLASCSPTRGGCDAQAAIWVAPEFRCELAEALHRLNDWTGAGISFYGVKIEAALVAGNSDPEPRFRKVVYPGGWNKGETQPPGQSESPDARRLREFFEPLIADVARTGILPATPVQLYGHTGRYFPSPAIRASGYATTLEGRPMRG